MLQGKRRILGVDHVADGEEYNQFDELPPVSVGVQATSDCGTGGTTYLRSDHDEGIYIDKLHKNK